MSSRSPRAARAEIVAAAQAMLRLGLVTGSAATSARASGELVYITPAALRYPGMTADDLVHARPRRHGRRGRAPSRRANGGCTSPVYAARPDVARAGAHPQRARDRAGAIAASRCGRCRPRPDAPAGSDEVARGGRRRARRPGGGPARAPRRARSRRLAGAGARGLRARWSAGPRPPAPRRVSKSTQAARRRDTLGVLERLPDGATILIRPIRADDKRMLEDGLRHLSPRVVHRRFLSPKRSFSRSELRYLTEVDGRDHVALVAEYPGEPVRRLIAVGRFVRLHGRPRRRRGGDRGRRRLAAPRRRLALAERLAAEARRLGIRSFTATMASDNVPAHKLMRAAHRATSTSTTPAAASPSWCSTSRA